MIIMRWKACNNKQREEQEKRLWAPCSLMQGLCRENFVSKENLKVQQLISENVINLDDYSQSFGLNPSQHLMFINFEFYNLIKNNQQLEE